MLIRDIIRAFSWKVAACLFVAGILIGCVIWWRIDAPAFRRLKAELDRYKTSTVMAAPPEWLLRWAGVKKDTVTLTQYRTDPTLTQEVVELRRRWAEAEERATFWQWLFTHRDTLPGTTGVVTDSAVAESLMGSWAFKSVRYRNGKVEYLAFLTPAIVKSGRLDLRGARRWSMVGTPNGVSYDRARRFLGADWRAFAGVTAMSNYDTFAPSIVADLGIGIDRGPWGVELGYSQPTFPLRDGKVFAKLVANWRW